VLPKRRSETISCVSGRISSVEYKSQKRHSFPLRYSLILSLNSQIPNAAQTPIVTLAKEAGSFERYQKRTGVSTFEFIKAVFWAGILPFCLIAYGGLAPLTAYLTVMAAFYWFILKKGSLAGVAIVAEWALMVLFYTALVMIELLGLLLIVAE